MPLPWVWAPEWPLAAVPPWRGFRRRGRRGGSRRLRCHRGRGFRRRGRRGGSRRFWRRCRLGGWSRHICRRRHGRGFDRRHQGLHHAGLLLARLGLIVRNYRPRLRQYDVAAYCVCAGTRDTGDAYGDGALAVVALGDGHRIPGAGRLDESNQVRSLPISDSSSSTSMVIAGSRTLSPVIGLPSVS